MGFCWPVRGRKYDRHVLDYLMMITIIIILFSTRFVSLQFSGSHRSFRVALRPLFFKSVVVWFLPLLPFPPASSILAANSSFTASEAEQCITGIFFYFFGLPPPRPSRPQTLPLSRRRKIAIRLFQFCLVGPSEGIKEERNCYFKETIFSLSA